ncbi:DUF6414 family protein [Enterococcus sp. AZ102]|uniref:DUF6414 family protein n=1 Tax=Enterococcus sp. AZ102 TaxID=2774865 RepID=UPI003F26CBEB
MKEHIYFDRALINSSLAQIDEGLLTKAIAGQTTADTSQEDGGHEITNGGSGGVKAAIFNAEGQYSKKEIDKFSTVYSRGNSELIETALDDYSLDILIDKLEELSILKKDLDTLEDGNIFISTNSFSIFDFTQLKDSVKRKNLEYILKSPVEVEEAKTELAKLNANKGSRLKHEKRIKQLELYLKLNDPFKNYGYVSQFAEYASILFPNTILFRIGQVLAFCDFDFLRIKPSLLTFLAQTTRKITILGIVTTKRNDSLVPKEGMQLSSDIIASSASAILSDILLDKYELAPVGSYFVRPIAIYFDS